MTAVVKQGTEIMFAEYGLHRIEANYMPRNARSPRVLERCGFRHGRGLRRGIPRKSTGKWEDHVLTSLTNR